MLKKIKSLYFIKLIYEYVDEAQKLKLIRYNKGLQKFLDISLIHYKHFKGNYIKFEPNGIVKEYKGFSGRLIYEGEYLNGKKHGKGRQDWNNGNLWFEGEYLNGKKMEKEKNILIMAC